jgi:RNA polymerase sigma factor (sigma-70 family)
MLRIVLDVSPDHGRRASITLDLPGKTLAAATEAPSLEPAIRGAVAEIERQVEKYKASVRGEEWWKRLARRKKLRERKAAAVAGSGGLDVDFHSAVDPHLSTLSHFARHLVRYAESRGDLQPGELDPDDLVSDVLLRAYDEWAKQRPTEPVRGWLMRLAQRQLQSETVRSRRERGQTIPLEKSAPLTPPSEEVTTLGEEILDFYQPDEALKIEDVLPDIRTPSPEEDLELRELRRCVREALNQLPKEQRRALVRRYVFGLDRDEARKGGGKGDASAGGTLEAARERLRQILIDSGCAFEPPAGERSPATAWNTAAKQLK